MFIYVSVLCAILCLGCLCVDEDSTDEQRLLTKLLQRYDPASRPVYNASHNVTVMFGLTVTQISDMVSTYFYLI